jgi:hypothetical protein
MVHTLGSFLKIAQNNGLLYSNVPVMYLFRQKMGWATFWATCSQTQLITLCWKGLAKKSTQTVKIFADYLKVLLRHTVFLF